MASIYTKLPQYFQMTIEYTNFFIPRPSKIYPTLDFWLENIPSGNPGERKERKFSSGRKPGLQDFSWYNIPKQLA
jgi:hypothetical protein